MSKFRIAVIGLLLKGNVVKHANDVVDESELPRPSEDLLKEGYIVEFSESSKTESDDYSASDLAEKQAAELAKKQADEKAASDLAEKQAAELAKKQADEKAENDHKVKLDPLAKIKNNS